MFAPLVLFSSLVVHSSRIFVLRVKVFSLHTINWALLVIFASVLRCDSQSFGPVYSFIIFGLFGRPSISSNLGIVLQVFCLFSLLFSFSLPLIAIAQFCRYFFFTLYLFDFCFANRMSSLRFGCRKAIDSIKLFVRKIKACKGRDFTSLLKPFAYSAWILYYHQYMWFLAPDAIIMIFATVWAVTCVRRNPETFSRDLRIVTRSVHDCKKIVIYSKHRQKQIKFRHTT